MLQLPTLFSRGGAEPLVFRSNGCFACPLSQTDLVFTVVAGQQCLPLLRIRVSDFGDSRVFWHSHVLWYRTMRTCLRIESGKFCSA